MKGRPPNGTSTIYKARVAPFGPVRNKLSCTVVVPRVLEQNSQKCRDLAEYRMNRQCDIEPYWQDEEAWLCTIGFLPGDDPEAWGKPSATCFGYSQFNEYAHARAHP